jgi:acetolactate synthase-1/3 small subunit
MKEYTITVYTEDRVGITNRITIILTRRQINIDSLMGAETEIPGVYKITITTHSTKQQLDKVVAQIEKLIEVHKAFVHEAEEVVYQEMALYKISTSALEKGNIEQLIREVNARILTITPKYFVIEKTGHAAELLSLLELLQPYGVMEFARSGRVSIVKWSRRFHEHLKDLSQVKEDNLKIS